MTRRHFNRTEREGGREGERGSAMVLAILVTVIMTLLGVSFLMMAQTENRIAENELRAAQALYVAEAGARLAKRWFDDPGGALRFPTSGQVDRSLRIIDDDGQGPNAPRAAQAGERYKANVDLDGNGSEDLFERPYRGTLQDTLLGTEDGPDMRITDAGLLATLSAELFGDFPHADAGLVATIDRIDLYAPPFARTTSGWVRFGVGTVKVVARIYDDDQPIAERTIKAVLNEAPYPGPYGVLHSCAGLTYQPEAGGRLDALHWGAVTALEQVVISAAEDDFPASFPRSMSGFVQLDPIWGPLFGLATLAEYRAYIEVAPQPIDDPWFRLLTAGTIVGLPAGDQPVKSDWSDWDGSVGTAPSAPDHSNLLQNQFVQCPEYDYATWKMIATTGGPDVRYFAWDTGKLFKENGRGVARSFDEITNGNEGIYFFDTRDGLPPAADGSNLSPAIRLAAGEWSFRGMLYLNSETFQAAGVVGTATEFTAPGEPYEDLNQNGVHEPDKNGNGVMDPGDEGWIDLEYSTTLDGVITVGSGGVRDAMAPAPIASTASLRGVLYTNGKFEATGSSRHHGSIVARGGVVQEDTAAGRPEIFFDQRIVGAWPPPGWKLPRVVISSWVTDL